MHHRHTTILGVSHLPQVCEATYRKFVKQIAAPLYHLSEKKKAWMWIEECEVAFDTLKKKLTSAPILAFPDFTEAFILDADASSCGLGAVLASKYRGKGASCGIHQQDTHKS